MTVRHGGPDNPLDAVDGGREARRVIEVRTAGAADLAQLAAVESAADELFVPLGITDLPAPPSAAERARSWRVLVAGRPVQGFAVLELLDGAVHLEQLSVHPAAGRRGIGGALLAAAVDAAREQGLDRVTLVTYAEVPWNAPFYARHGWRALDQPTPGLRALRRRETALGLDRHGPRTVMVRPVPPGPAPLAGPSTGAPTGA